MWIKRFAICNGSFETIILLCNGLMDSEFQNLYFTIQYVIFKIITSDVEIKK